ncbi:hypothetical protein OG413_22715 [Streptomyces sp. NBC_01433]|uniref:hypothetical protein n=1 Tax=Streptomyces sp. NBC_01433 TaxID=2903864 RepID=UPI002252DD87|nr:hypothetical protein [Streptomyces sp. NBC_01433]MCX4678093.1 hypothetical protein [Streptomyces sp. NBC_01433]
MTGRTATHYAAEVSGGDAVRRVELGGFVAPSRRLALRWLRGRALWFAEALDPAAHAPWVPPAALHPVTHAGRDAPADLRAWAEDIGHQDYALWRLAAGFTFEFIARDDACWYGLAARPCPLPGTPRTGIPPVHT